jgi:parallel beta-helix repeat protein
MCPGQKSGYLVGAEVILADANDPPFNQVKPGDTLFFAGGNKKYLNIRNFQGKSGSPIVMINKNGAVTIDTDHYFGISIENCKFVKFTGTGESAQQYGFQIKRVANGSGLGIGYLSSDFEIDHISIENTLIAGLYAKTDPNCSANSTRDSFTQHNTIIHDNYIAYTGNEGLYVGSSKYFGQVVNCDGRDTLLMPGLLDGVRIYNNTVKYSGWDGIQVGSAYKNCQIYNNTVLFDSQNKEDNQMSGILIGAGTKCDCFNNFISEGNGDGIECHGLGGTRIFNNIVVDAGFNYYPGDKSMMKHGIFVSDGSVQKDSSFYIMHNDIIRPKSDGIRFSSQISKGNYVSSNVILMPGNFEYYEHDNTNYTGQDAYIMFQFNRSNTTVKNNFFSMEAGKPGFVSAIGQLPGDFMLLEGSPLIDAAELNPKTAVSFDFLNFHRPVGPKPDIGAYEYEGVTSTFQIIADSLQLQSWTIPNPVTAVLKIYLQQDTIQELASELYDLRGSIVGQSSQSKLESGHQVVEFNVANLSKGVYIYKIRSKKVVYSGKFVKM